MIKLYYLIWRAVCMVVSESRTAIGPQRLMAGVPPRSHT